jgi:aminopeptidase
MLYCAKGDYWRCGKMGTDFEGKMDHYAELIINVGLNLQPEQRLIIGVPEYNTGAPLESAPLIRLLVEKAYKRGASLVDVIWGDDELLLTRFENAAPDTLEKVPAWQAQALLETAQSGGAFLTVLGNDPDLLKHQDPELVAQLQQAVLKNLDPAMDYVVRSAINWCVIGVSTPAWAAKVLPDIPADQQVAALWEKIFKMCRLDEADPVEAWEEHGRQIHARCEYMTTKKYSSLRLTGPETDLTTGLPQGHRWCGAFMTRQDGLPYVANLPTEEIFTLPHRTKAEGHLTASMPLSYGGALMEEFTLSFEGGRIVNAQAKNGQSVLQKLLETDEGSNRLGEIALVPHSSPIAQTGLLFYNILIDENAATHCALGSAYKFSIEGGDRLTDEEFVALGGNPSILHVDFMIGSEHMDVDGITEAGSIEPVMRAGEWAFEV